MAFTRKLGRSGITFSALGMGCLAIGGHLWEYGIPLGWGNVEDAESIRALQHAFDLGVNFIDTADVYGAGHSERILGKAFTGRRHDIVIATKFNSTFDDITP
jgi:aryl-alcohol dehydrogenase-like predicted oxidoreductase